MGGENPDEKLVMERVGGRGGTPIVKFIGVDTREQSDALAGRMLWIEPEELPELEEGLVYESDILFAEVQTVEGECLGRVEEIIETGEHDVMVIRDGDREILLPATLEVIVEIRRAEHTIRVKPPAGLEA